ncbi:MULTISPECIES: Cfr10I/Bse634I family restriction endonuclease [Shewanella]|uniref:Cfr10I/Bse634I family restriction endonuclease n=1 Tax=Shewanella TaxID=22 RepID=UPI00200FAFC8|nr:Cfr10I/Bse634I family restriction endonuclease [Shewanella kaireitica]MCL1096171.1 Cfr10I/Bse634I family restriction endonuclease [Shewanella kaireitica]
MPQLVKNDRNGKAIVDTKNAFITSINGLVPHESWDYDSHLDYIQKLVQTEDSRVTSGAISNCRGTWFEWMIAIDIYNHWCTNGHNLLMLPLPNISRFDSATLYQESVCAYIFDLRAKLKVSLDIELITSNPDFVIFDTTAFTGLLPRDPITVVNNETIDFIENIFRKFIGECSFTDILGYMATKTSLRPDRRLQIVHEGSLTKALYVHLQTRLWIDKPRSIKYFGASLKLNDKDRQALKTVATHSITTVLSEPERAVDECFELSSRDKLLDAIREMTALLFPELALEGATHG